MWKERDEDGSYMLNLCMDRMSNSVAYRSKAYPPKLLYWRSQCSKLPVPQSIQIRLKISFPMKLSLSMNMLLLDNWRLLDQIKNSPTQRPVVWTRLNRDRYPMPMLSYGRKPASRLRPAYSTARFPSGLFEEMKFPFAFYLLRNGRSACASCLHVSRGFFSVAYLQKSWISSFLKRPLNTGTVFSAAVVR